MNRTIGRGFALELSTSRTATASLLRDARLRGCGSSSAGGEGGCAWRAAAAHLEVPADERLDARGRYLGQRLGRRWAEAFDVFFLMRSCSA